VGKVRILGVAAPARFAGAPDMPTFAEQGIPLNSAPWVGILAPAKTPADIVDKLNRDVNAALDDASVQETLVKNGLAPQTRKQPEFKAFLDTEYDRWGATIKSANIKAE
jgi:tripartite-type tricarboxylate transporter receptor subunit TctC